MSELDEFLSKMDEETEAQTKLPKAFLTPVAVQPGDQFGLPPQCLHDVAAEIDELPTIAKRWSIPLKRLEQLLETPSIKLQVEQKRAEMKASGLTFRMKAEVLAEDIMLEAYHAAKDPESSNAFKLQTAQWLTKIADREPKQNAIAPGTGFSLQINIPSPTGPTQTIDITATPQQLQPPVEQDSDDADIIDAKPEWVADADDETTL